MNRNQIEYVLTLARLKNFGQAADACYITQSTLSTMVAKFEEQAGVTIFNRKTRPVSITAQGQEILKSLQNIQREYQILDERINEIKEYEKGHISIAAIPTVAPYLYPLILNDLSQQFPKVEFNIYEFTTEMTIGGIISGEIDIGIVSTPLGHKDLTEYPLYYEDFLLYDCDTESQHSSYKVSDVDLDRLWLLEEGHCLRNQIGKICELKQQKKINGNLIYSCGTIFTLIEMVKKNRGVTLLPRMAVLNNSQIDPAFLHELTAPVPTRQIGLITHKHFIKKRMLRTLSKTIQDQIHTLLPHEFSEEQMVTPY